MYGVPFGIAYYSCVVYNVDMFEEYGWRVPETYDEWWALMETARDAGFIAEPVAGAESFMDGFAMKLFGSFAGDEYEMQAIKGDILWNHTIFVTAMEEMVKMYEAGFFPPAYEGVGFFDTITMFLNEESPWIVTWNELFPSMIMNGEMGEFNFTADHFQIPAATEWGGRVTAYPGYPLSMTTACEHKDEAILFLDYIFSPPNWGVWLFTGSFIPLQQAAMEEIRSGDAFVNWEGADEMQAKYPEYYDEWVRLMQNCLEGDAYWALNWSGEMYEWEASHQMEVIQGRISIEEYLSIMAQMYADSLAARQG
jgi:raffinose/stachyose/melibiose transport system substrate-binding protein